MWEHHLGLGFFGFSRGSGMRWARPQEVRPGREEQDGQLMAAFDVVRDDVGEAIAEVHDVIEAFFRTVNFPEAPAFAGGVLDAWPARMVDGLAVARREWQAIQAHHAHLEREEAKRNG